MIELFGIAPAAPSVRMGGWGLVVTLATLMPGARLEAITEEGAVIRSRSGVRKTYPRFQLVDGCVVWWACTEIIGSNEN